MSTKRKSLGRGMDALIPSAREKTASFLTDDKKDTTLLSINVIKPNKEQPRRVFDDTKLEQLSMSIKQYGVLQPIIVNKDKEGDTYTIIAGERRYRASRLAGLKELPVIIKNYTESEILEIALIENIQREDLNPIEEANCYKKLIDEFMFNAEDISTKVNKSKGTITNTLSLLKLCEPVQELILFGKLKVTHAKALINVADVNLQYNLAEKAIEEDLSVTELEKVIQDSKKEQKTTKNEIVKNDYTIILNNIENDLQQLLGLKIKIKDKNKKGKLEINYTDHEQLEGVVNLLKQTNK